MKNLILQWLLLAPSFCAAQVGIGTTSPNAKSILELNSTTQGFLMPRMTWQQKSELGLTVDDAGMMVYQTDQPGIPNNYIKGLYFYDGSSWVPPVTNGTSNGQTLRWDGKSWIATSNLFNQGSSIGIGTQNPNSQLQIHSVGASATRIQFTNTTTGPSLSDGLLVGVTLSNSYAHMIQQENKPLWFGTNALERMRIDSSGNVGIGRTNPTAKLDVNGTVKIGTSGSVLHEILKTSVEVMIPVIAAGEEGTVDIPLPNVLTTAAVHVSPGSAMSGLMIEYAMVTVPGNVQVKFMNMTSSAMDSPLTITLHIAAIQ